MKRELSRRDLLNAGTSISAVVPLARAQAPLAAAKAESKGMQAAPWWQVQVAAKKQLGNKLAETAGQIKIAAGKSARPADRISSGERQDSKNGS